MGPKLIIVRFTTLSLVMCSGHWSNLVIGENVLIEVVSKFPLSFGAQREEAENEISLNEN